MFIKSLFLHNTEQPNGGVGGTEKTKDQIDKQNEFRKTQGLEPLPYPEGMEGAQPAAAATPEVKLSSLDQFKADKVKELSENNPTGLTAEQITAEAEKLVRAEADRIKLEQDAEAERLRIEAAKTNTPTVVKIAAKAPVKVTKVEDEPKVEDDIEDEILLKQLSKKAGREIKSIDEFINPKVEVTPQEKELQLQERETAKLEYGLKSKKISKTDIESFIEDTKNPQSVVFNFYAEQQKELDSSLTDKQIKDNYEQRYSLDADPESLEYKLGQKEISFVANSIISKKHSKYLNLESEYSAHENEQNQTQEEQKSILHKSPLYKKDVEEVFKRIGKFKVAGYEVELEEDTINGYKNQMLEPEYTKKVIKNGYALDDIEKAARNSMILDNFEEIVSGILEQDRLKNQAGARGIIPQKKTTPQNIFTEEQNDERKKLQERLGIQVN